MAHMIFKGITKKGAGGHFDGHEKEPKQPHGPKVGGKHPIIHSHTAKISHARKINRKGRSGKHGM